MADAQLANNELQPALDEAAHAAREGAEILDRLDTVLSSTDPVATWVAVSGLAAGEWTVR
jgi:hypothetical protein